MFGVIVVFTCLHGLVALHGLKDIYLPPAPCPSLPRPTPTTARPRPEPPRQNLFYSKGTKSIDLWISAALLDDRGNLSRVRLFGAERRDAVKGEFFCRWRYSRDATADDDAFVEVKAEHTLVDAKWPHWGPIFASHFMCRLPKGLALDTISLVSRDGSARFEDIPVDRAHRLTPRRKLGVCVKPATNALSVPRLVEWFETLRAAGIEDVIMYHADVMGNGRYVLEYYQKLGVLTLVSYPFLLAILERVDTATAQLSGQDRYAVYQQIYLTALQECLYRFRSSYEHLLFIDIDEVLLPIKDEPLQHTLAKIKKDKPTAAGYLFLTSWHFEDFGAKKNDKAVDKLYMLKYLESTEPIDNQPKCVVNTDRAELVNFHGVMYTLDDNYHANHVVPWQQYGYLHHFRGRCDKKFEKKRCTEELLPRHRPDPVLARYRDRVVAGVSRVIEVIQLH